MHLWDPYMYMTPLANGYVTISTNKPLNIDTIWFCKICIERSLFGRKYQFPPKVVFLLPWGVPFTTWVHSEC